MRNQVIFPEPTEEGFALGLAVNRLRPIHSPHVPVQWWPKKDSSAVWEPIFAGYAEFPVIDN